MKCLIKPILFLFTMLLAQSALAGDDYKRVAPLVTKAQQNVVNEAIRYPDGEAEVTSLIVTMQPGETTGSHAHGVPTYGYVLEGELSVDYKEIGKKVFPQGTAFMEAMSVLHNGHNDGNAPVRVLVVYMGANGVKNVLR